MTKSDTTAHTKINGEYSGKKPSHQHYEKPFEPITDTQNKAIVNSIRVRENSNNGTSPKWGK